MDGPFESFFIRFNIQIRDSVVVHICHLSTQEEDNKMKVELCSKHKQTRKKEK